VWDDDDDDVGDFSICSGWHFEMRSHFHFEQRRVSQIAHTPRWARDAG